MVENPLVVEDGQYFLEKVLWLQMSLTILFGGGKERNYHCARPNLD